MLARRRFGPRDRRARCSCGVVATGSRRCPGHVRLRRAPGGSRSGPTQDRRDQQRVGARRHRPDRSRVCPTVSGFAGSCASTPTASRFRSPVRGRLRSMGFRQDVRSRSSARGCRPTRRTAGRWRSVWLEVAPGRPVVESVEIGHVLVRRGTADVLRRSVARRHGTIDEPSDDLFDVVFWGSDADQVAASFGASLQPSAGDEHLRMGRHRRGPRTGGVADNCPSSEKVARSSSPSTLVRTATTTGCWRRTGHDDRVRRSRCR